MQSALVQKAEFCPITALSREHRHIERVLHALDRVVRATRESDVMPDPVVMRGIVDFIEDFADKRHHAKEEQVLFEEMAARSFGDGALACMRRQHDLGREFAGRMRDWLSADRDTQQKELDIMLHAADAFQELLTRHIGAEDGVLFPMALARLPPSSIERVAQRFREIEPPSAAREFAAAADAAIAAVSAMLRARVAPPEPEPEPERDARFLEGGGHPRS